MNSHLVSEENSAPKTLPGTVRQGWPTKSSRQEGSSPNLPAQGITRCQKGDHWDKDPVSLWVRQQTMQKKNQPWLLVRDTHHWGWATASPDQLWCSGHSPGNGGSSTSGSTGINQSTGKLPGGLRCSWWLSEPSLTPFVREWMCTQLLLTAVRAYIHK